MARKKASVLAPARDSGLYTPHSCGMRQTKVAVVRPSAALTFAGTTSRLRERKQRKFSRPNRARTRSKGMMTAIVSPLRFFLDAVLDERHTDAFAAGTRRRDPDDFEFDFEQSPTSTV